MSAKRSRRPGSSSTLLSTPRPAMRAAPRFRASIAIAGRRVSPSTGCRSGATSAACRSARAPSRRRSCRRCSPAGLRSRGWTPRDHQLELLAKAQAGRSSLLIAPTGGGKTLAGFLPTLGRTEPGPIGQPAKLRAPVSTGRGVRRAGGLHTLYISPLKALAVDIARNLETPVAEMGLPIRIETRTGDTPASKRQRQRRDPPDILLTTPEQLALLLASADAPYMFGILAPRGARRVALAGSVEARRPARTRACAAISHGARDDEHRALRYRRRAGRALPLFGGAACRSRR